MRLWNPTTNPIHCSILAIDAPQYVYEFVKRSINMSFDHTDRSDRAHASIDEQRLMPIHIYVRFADGCRERELLSRLLSTGYPDVFSSNMIGKGFERLFELVRCPNPTPTPVLILLCTPPSRSTRSRRTPLQRGPC